MSACVYDMCASVFVCMLRYSSSFPRLLRLVRCAANCFCMLCLRLCVVHVDGHFLFIVY
jgi:hypothetical protein